MVFGEVFTLVSLLVSVILEVLLSTSELCQMKMVVAGNIFNWKFDFLFDDDS